MLSEYFIVKHVELIIRLRSEEGLFDLEVITRLFSYRHPYQARASITARDVAEGCCRPKKGLIYGTI